MRPLVLLGILSILLLAAAVSTAFSVMPTFAGPSVGIRRFRLLAVEAEYDSCRMKSGQFLIQELLRYQNWNNATIEYVSHIHLLSMYDHEEVNDTIKPYLRGFSTEANVRNEVLNFLGQADPGEIVIFYYCGHGDDKRLFFYDGTIFSHELDEWLLCGKLPKATVTVILDTCLSGSWINDGEGSIFGSRRIVMASSTSSQTSWGWCESWSWFTHVGVIEGFQLANDSDGDGWISAAENFAFAKPHTESYALQFGLTQSPQSYFDLASGDVPLVQRDETKAFPLWDIAVINGETSVDVVLAGSPVTISVTVENQGIKKWNPLITLYCNSAAAAEEAVTIDPKEAVTLSILWNTSGIQEALYLVNVVASVAPGEIDLADNTFVDGNVRVYNAIIDIKPQNLKLTSEGTWIKCHIELPPILGAEVCEIDVSSVKLGGEITAEDFPITHDVDHDGIPELTVKFDREAVVSHILSTGVDGYVTGFSRWVTLKVVGKLMSGVPFEGYDTIRATFNPPWKM